MRSLMLVSSTLLLRRKSHERISLSITSACVGCQDAVNSCITTGWRAATKFHDTWDMLPNTASFSENHCTYKMESM